MLAHHLTVNSLERNGPHHQFFAPNVKNPASTNGLFKRHPMDSGGPCAEAGFAGRER